MGFIEKQTLPPLPLCQGHRLTGLQSRRRARWEPSVLVPLKNLQKNPPLGRAALRANPVPSHTAIEAMKNAHREELERELEKSQRSQISSVNADIEALRRQYL